MLSAELKPMLRVAGPVILAELGWMSMGVVDTIMVGPLGPAAIGAVGVGTSLHFALAIAADADIAVGRVRPEDPPYVREPSAA